MEQQILLDEKELCLEGLLSQGHDKKGAILTHPHPLYGGDMHNAVITTLARAYQEMGWTTLRFNFRGVGLRQSAVDDGKAEVEDLQAAIAYLQETGIERLHLTGYSFGAWVLSCWAHRRGTQPHPILMVAPPVALIRFPAGPLPALKAVFTGRQDELAPPAQIQSLLPQWHPDIPFIIIENTDHFFYNKMDELKLKFSQSIKDNNL